MLENENINEPQNPAFLVGAVISRQSLIDALGKICGGKYFFIGYYNGSHDFSLSEKSEEDLADEIIEAISDGL